MELPPIEPDELEVPPEAPPAEPPPPPLCACAKVALSAITEANTIVVTFMDHFPVLVLKIFNDGRTGSFRDVGPRPPVICWNQIAASIAVRSYRRYRFVPFMGRSAAAVINRRRRRVKGAVSGRVNR
jgi:hypothetical protein